MKITLEASDILIGETFHALGNQHWRVCRGPGDMDAPILVENSPPFYVRHGMTRQKIADWLNASRAESGSYLKAKANMEADAA